ncbi:MAG: Asp23/Gls24 family envelope stress response protein [Candidatus Omnitrophica bacterium]|nr:Asp23/Gls24 family envelope stress response protein [Candidatus Omnitrophota bacterium]
MINDSKINLGSIQVEKQVIADIIASAVSEIDGVNLIKRNMFEEFMLLIGLKITPGAQIRFTDNNELLITVKVLIPFGINIQEAAQQIQSVIRSALAKMVDLNIKEINVNISGIQRGP